MEVSCVALTNKKGFTIELLKIRFGTDAESLEQANTAPL